MTEQIVGHTVITDEAEALRRLEGDEVIGIDTETSGLSPFVDQIATVQMYGDQTGTLALFHPRGNLSDNLRGFLSNHRAKWLVHNGVGFDIPFLLNNDVQADGMDWFDTLVGETVVIGSNRANLSKSLRNTLKRRLDIDLDKGLATSHWMAADLTPDQVRYATSDVVHLPALWRSQVERAEKTRQLGALDFEMELVPIIARMTFNGMPISVPRLREFLKEQERQVDELRPKLIEELGDINFNSHQQLAAAFHQRGIEIPNTRKETMIDMAQHGGKAGYLAELVLAYKRPAQRMKMYRDEWIKQHVIAGRAHPRFWQCSTDTTRVASSDPNLQQVPRDMREPWGWEPGMTIVSADYSQIEVRIAAYKAKDEALLRALENDDAHAAVASEIQGVPLAEVTKEMRKAAKAETFTLLFGGGPETLYQYAKLQGSRMSLAEAEAMVNRFFGTFKGLAAIRAWAEQTAEAARYTQHPVKIRLPAGHLRVLFGSQARSTVILNTIVQGAAATGIKHAMIECKRRGLEKYLAIQVHDELVACVPDGEAADYARELEDAMKVGMAKIIPSTVKVGVHMGPSWAETPAA